MFGSLDLWIFGSSKHPTDPIPKSERSFSLAKTLPSYRARGASPRMFLSPFQNSYIVSKFLVVHLSNCTTSKLSYISPGGAASPKCEYNCNSNLTLLQVFLQLQFGVIAIVFAIAIDCFVVWYRVICGQSIELYLYIAGQQKTLLSS